MSVDCPLREKTFFFGATQMRAAACPVQQIRTEGFVFELQTAAATTSSCSLSLLLPLTFL